MTSIRKFIPKKLRRAILGWMARFGFAVCRVMPRHAGLALFSFLGTVCYYLLSSDRKRTVKNLRFIYGDKWCKYKVRATARNVFRSLGKNLFDAVHLGTLSAKKYDEIVSHDSLVPMEIVRDGGKGGILVMAHLGCFENASQFFARKGFSGVAVGRAFKNAAVDEIVRKMRNGPGVYYVDRSENPRKIVRLLKEGRFMGALIDQDTDVEGVFADFMGHPAFTPSSAVRFAMKFNIPIIISVTARQKGDKHHVYISDIIKPADTGDFEADLVSTIQNINGIICGYIRKYPDQWVWMHERWKTKKKVNRE